MTTLKITRRQFDIIVASVEESAVKVSVYLNDKSDLDAFFDAREKDHLANLFEVYENGSGTKITNLEIVE